jgi:hypothetical protein
MMALSGVRLERLKKVHDAVKSCPTSLRQTVKAPMIRSSRRSGTASNDGYPSRAIIGRIRESTLEFFSLAITLPRNDRQQFECKCH